MFRVLYKWIHECTHIVGFYPAVWSASTREAPLHVGVCPIKSINMFCKKYSHTMTVIEDDSHNYHCCLKGLLCDMILEPICMRYMAVSSDGRATVVFEWGGRGMNDRTPGVVISCPTNVKSSHHVARNAFSIFQCLCSGLELVDGRPQSILNPWYANTTSAKGWTRVISFQKRVE
jgi:hypothetical protein